VTGEPGSRDARPADGSRLPGPQRAFERALALSRLLVLIPVIFLLLDAAASFVYGADILIRTLTEVVGEPAHVGARLGRFLIVMDTFLVGVTLMILAFGFYELFVITRERAGHKYWLPGWLHMHDIEDLKARVVSMLILVAAITFVDRLVESKNEQEILFLGVGISIIIVALTAFLWIGRSKPPGRRPRAVPAVAAGPAPGGVEGGVTAGGAVIAPVRPQDAAGPEASSLPAGPTARTRRRGRVTAILSSTRLAGHWDADAETVVTAVAGRALLDLREANLPDDAITVRVTAGLGAVSIIVPPEMEVAESGMTVLGIRSIRGRTDKSPGKSAPVLVLADTCVLGLVKVRRMARSPRWLHQPGDALRHQDHADQANSAGQYLLAVLAQPAFERLQHPAGAVGSDQVGDQRQPRERDREHDDHRHRPGRRFWVGLRRRDHLDRRDERHGRPEHQDSDDERRPRPRIGRQPLHQAALLLAAPGFWFRFRFAAVDQHRGDQGDDAEREAQAVPGLMVAGQAQAAGPDRDQGGRADDGYDQESAGDIERGRLARPLGGQVERGDQHRRGIEGRHQREERGLLKQGPPAGQAAACG
jgi:uncharacterized membrane protein YqhA